MLTYNDASSLNCLRNYQGVTGRVSVGGWEGRGGLVCFCTTIKQENQHLHGVQPQPPHNVEPIFRNHYSGDGKQKSRKAE